MSTSEYICIKYGSGARCLVDISICNTFKEKNHGRYARMVTAFAAEDMRINFPLLLKSLKNRLFPINYFPQVVSRS